MVGRLENRPLYDLNARYWIPPGVRQVHVSLALTIMWTSKPWLDNKIANAWSPADSCWLQTSQSFALKRNFLKFIDKTVYESGEHETDSVKKFDRKSFIQKVLC